jgi:hypothetical protein
LLLFLETQNLKRQTEALLHFFAHDWKQKKLHTSVAIELHARISWETEACSLVYCCDRLWSERRSNQQRHPIWLPHCTKHTYTQNLQKRVRIKTQLIANSQSL